MPLYILSFFSWTSLTNQFNPHWRECANLSKFIVNYIAYNKEEDKFFIKFFNEETKYINAIELKQPLDKYDMFTRYESKKMSDIIFDMYNCNFNFF